MKMLKLAVGFAAGYVLGTRAGREKYEQIAASARKAAAHPTVVQAQEKAKGLVNTGVDKTNAKLAAVANEDTVVPARVTPREPRPTTVPSSVNSQPLV